MKMLKHALTSAPILKSHDPDLLSTVVLTDATISAHGAFLEQGMGDVRHPVAYNSRSLTWGEKSYPTRRQELFGIREELRVITGRAPVRGGQRHKITVKVRFRPLMHKIYLTLLAVLNISLLLISAPGIFEFESTLPTLIKQLFAHQKASTNCSSCHLAL